MDFLQKAKALNMRNIIMTNGLLLNDKTINILKTFDVTLGISIDGAKAETHDTLRGVPGLFNHIIKTLNINTQKNLLYTKYNRSKIFFN